MVVGRPAVHGSADGPGGAWAAAWSAACAGAWAGAWAGDWAASALHAARGMKMLNRLRAQWRSAAEGRQLCRQSAA